MHSGDSDSVRAELRIFVLPFDQALSERFEKLVGEGSSTQGGKHECRDASSGTEKSQLGEVDPGGMAVHDTSVEGPLPTTWKGSC